MSFFAKLSFLALITAFTIGAISDPPLPYPATYQTIVDIPPQLLPPLDRKLHGIWAPNDVLADKAVRLFEGLIHGSESVVVDKTTGILWLLDKYGKVRRARPVHTSSPSDESGSALGNSKSSCPTVPFELDPEPLAQLGYGRPLGSVVDGNGDLLVCDSVKGLLKVEADSGRVSILATRVSSTSKIDPDTRITYANDIDVGPNGTVYFTDSQDLTPGLAPDGSFSDTLQAYMLGLLSGRFTGRLLSYEPTTGETHVLLGSHTMRPGPPRYWFTNGVAVSADGRFVAFVETNRMRVLRYWLQGPKAGAVDVLADRLPAFPDGISTAPDGSFWLALPSRPPPIVKYMKLKFVRTVSAWLPPALRPQPLRWGAVVKIHPDGYVQTFLMDTIGRTIAFISGVNEHDGRLLLGSLTEDYVAYLDLDQL